MEIWERAERESGAGAETAETEQPELHRLLRQIADEAVPPASSEDFFPQVIKRATRIRRRRRAVRASSVAVVLTAAVVLGPSAVRELGGRGGVAVAAPPAAVVDLASAYPAADHSAAPASGSGVSGGSGSGAADAMSPASARPANALSWAPRAAMLPTDAVDLATSYMTERVGPKPDVTGTASASVTPLWAQVEDDTTLVVPTRAGGALGPAQVGGVNVNGSPGRLVAQDAHKTWLFVMQGWTVGPDGAPSSQAVLLVGTYTQSARSTSMTVYSTPVAFAHARPGSGDGKDDTDQIAELSIWLADKQLPDSGQLLVLGAPQARTVLYAKTGGDLIPQKTVDGVALFPRTRSLVKGRYADTIQVRDAKNVALTPPKTWSAADFVVGGTGWRWVSTEPGWVEVAAGAANQGPAAPPSTVRGSAGTKAASPSASSAGGK